jgi:hypothetical protein
MPKIIPARHHPPKADSGEAGGDINHYKKKELRLQDSTMLISHVPFSALLLPDT